MKARVKKTKAPKQKKTRWFINGRPVAVSPADDAKMFAEMRQSIEPPRCAQCGRPPSHPHYGGGLVGGVYCTWYCAMLVHRQTGCGIFVVDKKGNYVELVATITGPSPHVMSPSEEVEHERKLTQPTLEMLLLSGMQPNGAPTPPKTTADMVEHIFGVKRFDIFMATGVLPVDAFPAGRVFLNGVSKR